MNDATRRMMQKTIADYRKSQQPVPPEPAKLPSTLDERRAARIANQGFLRGSYEFEHGLPWKPVQARADSVGLGLLPTRTESRLESKPSFPDSVGIYSNKMRDPSLPESERLGAREKFNRFKGVLRDIDPSAAEADDRAEAVQDYLYGTPEEKAAATIFLKGLSEIKGLEAKTAAPEKKVTLIKAQENLSDVLAKLNKLQKTPILTELLMKSLMENPSYIKYFEDQGITTSEQANSDTMKDLNAALQNEVDHWENYIAEEEWNEKVDVDETTGKINIKDF